MRIKTTKDALNKESTRISHIFHLLKCDFLSIVYKSMRKVLDDERIGLFISEACCSLDEIQIPILFVIC